MIGTIATSEFENRNDDVHVGAMAESCYSSECKFIAVQFAAIGR